MPSAATYKGCASTLPSVASGANKRRNLVEFTLDGDRIVSWRFCPVRAASLCHVSTLACPNRLDSDRVVARISNKPEISNFNAEYSRFFIALRFSMRFKLSGAIVEHTSPERP